MAYKWGLKDTWQFLKLMGLRTIFLFCIAVTKKTAMKVAAWELTL